MNSASIFADFCVNYSMSISYFQSADQVCASVFSCNKNSSVMLKSIIQVQCQKFVVDVPVLCCQCIKVVVPTIAFYHL